jgi:hypothetical protein
LNAATFHLTGTDAIAQGATFNGLTIVVDAKFVDWTPRGQIRTDYAEKGGIVKANFSFSAIALGEVSLPEGGKVSGAIIRPYLSATQTQSLDWLMSKMKAREQSRESAVVGRNVWLYDIELFKADTVERILQGFVEVSPEVTR